MIKLRPALCAELAELSQQEAISSDYPWKLPALVGSFKADHRVLCMSHKAQVMGYMVLLESGGDAPEVVELLNIVVFARFQSRGHAKDALRQVISEYRQRGAQSICLEVRESNQAAQRLYQHLGFVELNKRLAYYPTKQGGREAAKVMSLYLGLG